jgi:hypothetical protein
VVPAGNITTKEIAMSEPKAVSVTQLQREDDAAKRYYSAMDELVSKYHKHLRDAKIVLVWNEAWNEDTDGLMPLAKAKKCSDLDRELAGWDFVIQLNKVPVQAMEEPQLRALLDHELSHCEVARDESGEVKIDDLGRAVYRIRKHDVEEFTEVVYRHGIWKRDLERFAEAVQMRAKAPLLEPKPSREGIEAASDLCPDGTGKVTGVTLSMGGQSVTLTADTRKRIAEHLKTA